MARSQFVLHAAQLSYAYPQHGLGLQPVDFEARPGELWMITGRSGCGKSTFARCLTGLIPHLYRGDMRGDVWIEGLNTRRTPLWQICESVGMLFQNPAGQAVASTAEQEIAFGLENLGLPVDEQRARCRSYVDRFQLGHLSQRRPATLSGGEQQRLMLAAVLARQPKALILDEPLSMLDTTNATELVRHLEELTQQGTTIVACEHRADYLAALPATRQMRLPASRNHDEPLEQALPPAPVSSVGTVELQGLELGFTRQCLFQDLTLSLRGGEVVALIGRNGVGKTTLLRALAGLHPYGGTIGSGDGHQTGFGLMFQNPDWQLFNPTVRDEIRYHLRESDETLYAWLLQALSLEQYENVPPLLLSEGEKKRVALAILLMRHPRHGVLLDEPTLGQDDYHRQILGRAARGLADAGCIVVAATHDLAWARRCADRIVLLAPGRVVADGTTRDVLENRSAWAEAGLVIPPWISEYTC